MSEMIPTWTDAGLRPIDKLEVHRRGLRHQAVSVFLFRGEEMLIQRRALEKYHSGGLWANACCTHPRWGETPEACAGRRLRQELGLAAVPLTHRGRVEYRADVGPGMVEHEVVELFAGALAAGAAPAPDPAEVMALDWVTTAELSARIAARPEDFAPWLRIYMAEHAALFLI